jgi:hypothetical protein
MTTFGPDKSHPLGVRLSSSQLSFFRLEIDDPGSSGFGQANPLPPQVLPKHAEQRFSQYLQGFSLRKTCFRRRKQPPPGGYERRALEIRLSGLCHLAAHKSFTAIGRPEV